MEWPAVLLITFLCFVMVFWVKRRQFAQPAIAMPYRLKARPFPDEERDLLAALQQGLGDRFLVLARLPASEVVEIDALPHRSYWHHAYNRLAEARFDVLLCERHAPWRQCVLDFGPDDEDGFLVALCAHLGLPRLRLTPDLTGDPARLRQAVERSLAAR